ncbi:MAG: hypothetical protein HYY44_00945 [Deltaproteobacteria bacterium]|nr:hypothetical protein [Deltaproteobacteria bacterium]MBI4374758.1 hypothetical protein [Deltaproteobacteria bacterium]
MLMKTHGLLVCFFLLIVGCAGKKVETIETKAGSFVLGHGFSIDAHYDEGVDRLVPGYKLLTVAIRNTSLTVIQMNFKEDQWVVVSRHGKKMKAINSLRKKDPRRWNALPEEVQRLVDYPDEVPINYTATFNLFFPKSADLDKFEELQYKNLVFRKVFKIYR